MCTESTETKWKSLQLWTRGLISHFNKEEGLGLEEQIQCRRGTGPSLGKLRRGRVV